MRYVAVLALTIVACRGATSGSARKATAGASAPGVTADSTVVPISGPTFIAFYPTATQAQIDSDADLATTLDDFSYYLSIVQDSLQTMGFTVVEHPHGPLFVRESGATRQVGLPTDSADIGYVLLAPGRVDRVSYGVMTNSELLAQAREFLQLDTARRRAHLPNER
jgi:hypothetical protein